MRTTKWNWNLLRASPPRQWSRFTLVNVSIPTRSTVLRICSNNRCNDISHPVEVFQSNAYLPLFTMSQRGGGKYLRKADQVPSNKLSSPFIRAVSLSKGKTLYVSWYHCVTVGGLSLIHCFKIHLLARNRSLSQSLKFVLLRDGVF